MRKLLLGTAVIIGLARPAFATGVNTIAIDDGSGSAASLTIIQDNVDVGNTVSGNGSAAGAATTMPINGPWASIAINQVGLSNKLQGAVTSKGTSTTAALTANYTNTSGSSGNTHSLTIGGTTAPNNPAITVYVKNNGSTGVNSVTDVLDGATLSYNLGLQGSGNTVGNTVSASTGGVTLTEGSSGYGIIGNYGVTGNSNTIANTLTSGAGTVSASLRVSGDGNSLTNTVTTSGGNISLTQGGASAGITGGSNSISNLIGQSTPVGSFAQTLLVSGSGNTITNTVDSGGTKVVDQSLSATSSNNTIATTVSGGGAQTASLSIAGASYVDYALTSAASGSYANVALSAMGGTMGAPAIVRVEQTAAASGATANLTVAGGGNALGVVGTIPGTYTASGAGVVVYQNTSGAYLNASVTGAAVGYTVLFKQ